MKFIFYVIVLLQASHLYALPSVPVKYLNSEMTLPAGVESRFSQDRVVSNQFIEMKKAEWKACHHQHGNQKESENKDPLSAFLSTRSYIATLEEMESKELTEAQTLAHPWSGDYWAYANGILANRYQDEGFSEIYDWKSRYDYIHSNPALLRIEKLGQLGVNTLSPSEKYDLIIGDEEYNFTESNWNQGKAYYDDSGNVESWMGICHGWASASIMEPRPTKSIEVLSNNGKWPVHFNPSEIKGLVSYSWATNPYSADTLGSRCNTENPKRDEAGRIIEPDCHDLNPAAWHISIVHQIGKLNKAFIMDATYDYEVWNQPIVSYKYSYFNPVTKEAASSLSQASVVKEDFNNDKFIKHRSANMVKVVGIRMTVGYVVESSADSSDFDSVDNDIVRWVQYEYDLELDKNGKIIGGEWHTQGHPDFIWKPRDGSKPQAFEDRQIVGSRWDKSQPLPAIWAKAAKNRSYQGIILNHIVENLLRQASE